MILCSWPQPVHIEGGTTTICVRDPATLLRLTYQVNDEAAGAKERGVANEGVLLLSEVVRDGGDGFSVGDVAQYPTRPPRPPPPPPRPLLAAHRRLAR